MALPTRETLSADAEACVRCGACLPACPTYRATGLEIQSPRGRVNLYAAYAQGEVEDAEVVLQAAYDCLDCRACQTVCPTGVRPGEAALDTRVFLQAGQPQNLVAKAALEFFHHPRLIDAAGILLFLYQKTGLQTLVRKSRVLELLGPLARMESLLPAEGLQLPLRAFAPLSWEPIGEKKGEVAFFLGCVMNMVFSEASRATVEVIQRAGFGVYIPRATTCCGAPQIEEGDLVGFEKLAKQNLEAYGRLPVDHIVTDCAACAAELKKYARHFADDPLYGPLAQQVKAKTMLFSEFVRRYGLPQGSQFPFATTHQHACHACHGQGVYQEPREILKQTSDFRPLPGETDCCGSAGVYNLTHPEEAEVILKNKIASATQTGAQVLSAENPGCLMQLERGRALYQAPFAVRHLSLLVLEALKTGPSQQSPELPLDSPAEPKAGSPS
jgi:glycolate oxidase iron-sulfur subunit